MTFKSIDLIDSLYRSPNIVRVIAYRRVKWAGLVARMEEGAFKILTSTPAGKSHLGRPRLDGRTILESILKK